MVFDKEASRRWRRHLREVLNSHWDPIGVAEESPTEYDGYAGKVAAMLREGTTDEALFAYLNWAETQNMGLPGNPDRLRRTIAALRAIGFMS
jgi:hypothetical protein